VVVSDGFWRKQGRNPDLLGSEILINNRPFTVIGIMPREFTGTTHIVSTDVWVPLSVNHLVANDYRDDGGSMDDRKVRNLFLVARLKPGVTAASADPALKALADGIEQANPVKMKDQTFMAAPLPRFATSNNPADESAFSAVGALMLAMAAVVLLVACLNLANMLLARGAARRKEIAIRLAVGAQRRRVVRQLLTEGFVLALIGGVFGIVLALWSSDLLIASLGRLMPIDIVWSTGPNPALLAATFVFCLFGTLAFGLGPALKLSRADVIEDLKSTPLKMTRRRWKFLPRNPLVVVQFAFSLALVTRPRFSSAARTRHRTSTPACRRTGCSWWRSTEVSAGSIGSVPRRRTLRSSSDWRRCGR
jgi:ABC-type antimicrobial peptide transport system permease subunit